MLPLSVSVPPTAPVSVPRSVAAGFGTPTVGAQTPRPFLRHHVEREVRALLMLKLVLPPHAAALTELRTAVREWAAARRIPDWPLTLIATELAANAIAVTPPDEVVEVVVAAEGRQVEVRVSDAGPGFAEGSTEPGAVPVPSSEQPRGRGLLLVRQLSDTVLARRSHGRTVVSAFQRIPPAESGSETAPA